MPVKGSGVQDLESLRARCEVSEITGCWRFQAALSDGHPRIWMFDPIRGKVCVVCGPRAAAILAKKRLLPKWRAWMTCQRKDCVCPDHVKTGTVAQWGAWMAEHGKLKNSVRRKAAARRAWDNRLPANKEAARIVRESEDKTGRQLARELGLTDKVVSKMRNGLCWQEPPGPFAGLGAR
jgi:hypothetical protein